MKFRFVAIGLIAVLMAVYVFAPTSAQDDTEDRLSALETRVAVLETAISSNGVALEEPWQTPTSSAGITAHAYEFTGQTSSIIEPFDIDEGTYRATWSCDSSSTLIPSASLDSLGDSIGSLYISIGTDEQSPIQEVLQIYDDGRMVGEADCAGNWSLTLDILT